MVLVKFKFGIGYKFNQYHLKPIFWLIAKADLTSGYGIKPGIQSYGPFHQNYLICFRLTWAKSFE